MAMAVPDLSTRERLVDGLVAAACRLMGDRKEARSVHVVPHRRPTYDELRRYQEWALDRHVRLTVDGRGKIVVRSCLKEG